MRKNTADGDSKQIKRKTTHEQIGDLGSTNESPLGPECGGRSDAEAIGAIIADGTSQRLVAQAELSLEFSRQLEADSKRKLWDVLEGLESIERETQAYRDEIIADAQQQALDFIKLEAEAYRDEIIADAQQQARDHLEKSYAEAQQILVEAELVRNEVREELETQKILTDVAKLRAESHEVLEEIRSQLKIPEDS